MTRPAPTILWRRRQTVYSVAHAFRAGASLGRDGMNKSLCGKVSVAGDANLRSRMEGALFPVVGEGEGERCAVCVDCVAGLVARKGKEGR